MLNYRLLPFPKRRVDFGFGPARQLSLRDANFEISVRVNLLLDHREFSVSVRCGH
jgi:hypothetical protein